MSRKKMRLKEIFPGLPNRLRKIRGTHTQAFLADKLGVTNPTVSRYESGEVTPPIEILRKYADFAKTTIKDLLRDEEISIEETDAEYSTLPALNTQLLAQVIAGLERELDKRHIRLPPERKAHAISLIYDYCFSENKEVTPEVINPYLHLVK